MRTWVVDVFRDRASRRWAVAAAVAAIAGSTLVCAHVWREGASARLIGAGVGFVLGPVALLMWAGLTLYSWLLFEWLSKGADGK